MLKAVREIDSGIKYPKLKIGDVTSLAPFGSGLEYSAPARGGWTIVHIGMLLPESHQVFVCAQSCLRGVVLSAAELNDSHRFSTITVDEASVLEGNCEDIIIEGTAHILEGLPELPPALLLFTSCIHHFLGTDMGMVFGELARRFPKVGFVQCWMNPIMRKTKTPPDPFMRKQLYSLLRPAETDEKQVNMIGNNLAVDSSSELYGILERNGFYLKDICACKTFAEYENLASGRLNIVTHPLGRPAARELEERLGQRWIYMPMSYDWKETEEYWRMLSDFLELDFELVKEQNALAQRKKEAETALAGLALKLKDWAVAIDYTAVSRPLGLAKLLIQSGFSVKRIYVDTISDEEKDSLRWLREHQPEMELCPTVRHEMAAAQRNMAAGKHGRVLAVGQKAAYLTGTVHFVNIVEDGGLYGFGGILALARLMEQAAAEEKDAERLIQIKGWGCCC